MTVQFSKTSDFLEIVGATQADEQGAFSYLPVGMEHKVETTYYARAIDWDEYTNNSV